jgi:hypothetical protein
MASSEPSRKRGREEVPSPPPTEPEKVPTPTPAEPKEVPPPPPTEPEDVTPPPPTPAEVKPPPPEEVKPPRRKVAHQPVVPQRAPSVNVADACFSVKMLHWAFQTLGKVAVHLGVQ